MTTAHQHPSSRPGQAEAAPVDGKRRKPRVDTGVEEAGFAGEDPHRADSHRYLAGDVINRKYRLSRLLGEGGMGAVWLARNVLLDVDVAVKLIRREMAGPETSRRLLQEARAAARLRHPSIVRVFDFGESEHGDPFIVMEVLSGESLRDILERRARLPAVMAVRALLPVASALAAAHAQGIVHRDLKPENIVLVPDEGGTSIPKVVDFGIAKLREDGVDGRITLDGAVMGSPDYMSPEQARGRDEIDERTDVWAFAVVLYETITGVAPFSGHNYNALMTSIMMDEPTPTTSYAAGDEELWRILQRGLHKTREGRWPSMRELGAALASWCLAHGYDTDVACTSLAAHWHGVVERRSLPDVSSSRASLPDSDGVSPTALAATGAQSAVVTAPSRFPGGLHAVPLAPTVRPPSARDDAGGGEPLALEGPRRAVSRWVLVAAVGIAAGAAIALALALSGTGSAPATAATSGPSPRAAESAPPAHEAAAPATVAAPSPVASATATATAASASASPPRPRGETPHRNSSAPAKSGKPKGLEIPDAPNF
jgi:serine/threonine-protein kinase